MPGLIGNKRKKHFSEYIIKYFLKKKNYVFVFTNNLATVNVRQVHSKVVQYDQVVDLVGVL